MRPPLIQRPGRSASDRTKERGVTMALVALAMVGIIAMAGLSIDIGTLYQASAEAQRAADAAALAAARTISMQGLTGDPNNVSASWQLICGGPSGGLATPAANTVVTQNPISGASTSPVVTVTYSYSGNTSSPGGDCSAWAGTAFGVNPLVTVLVQQSNLPTYFSRIWGRTGNTVSATATAEAFNPSGSGTSPAGMVPVQPRCVKPWIVPNYDPLHPGGCSGTGGTGCSSLVGQTTGTIFSPGWPDDRNYLFTRARNVNHRREFRRWRRRDRRKVLADARLHESRHGISLYATRCAGSKLPQRHGYNRTTYAQPRVSSRTSAFRVDGDTCVRFLCPLCGGHRWLRPVHAIPVRSAEF